MVLLYTVCHGSHQQNPLYVSIYTSTVDPIWETAYKPNSGSNVPKQKNAPTVNEATYIIYHVVIKQFAKENPPMFKFGKPSISMGHLYHGYVSHNHRVIVAAYLW